MNDRIYSNTLDRLRSPERVKRLEVEKVINLCLDGNPISRILDIGTGSGLFAQAFNKAGLMVSGIDLNEEMIESAKKYLPNSEFKIAVAEFIPYDNNTFDASFFGLVFHEVDDYEKSLSEAYRVSKSSTFILEWKYQTEEFGPPIEHRLKSDFIRNLSKEIGYKTFSEISLTSLVLYKLGKS